MLLPLLLGLGGLVAIRSLPFFGSEDMVSGPFHHEEITREAARTQGWDDGEGRDDTSSAVASLAWHTDYVDSYLYNPVWWAAGGLPRFKASLLAQKHLVNVHFDDLNTTAQIATMWDRYLGGTVAGLLWAAARDEVPAARHLVGIGLHAQQDFYAHSAWVDDPARRSATWLEAVGALGATGLPSLDLYTGTYELPDHHGRRPHGKVRFDCNLLKNVVGPRWMGVFCDTILPTSKTSLCQRWKECQAADAAQPGTVGTVPIPLEILSLAPGIALDSTWQADIAVRNRDLPDRGSVDGAALFAAARSLAVRQSQLWLRMLDVVMKREGHGDFWSRVKTEPRGPKRPISRVVKALESFVGAYRSDLDQYEDRSRMLYTFLSAGTYPPPPDRGEEGWYLRVELTTSTEAFSGTDADIYADAGGQSFLLDHMHDRRPGGGMDEMRLLEYDDFEAGRRSAYVIGPFPELPSGLTLRNDAADVLDVLAGLWHDFVQFHKDLWDGFVELVLTLIGGHADAVGVTQSHPLSWVELRAILDAGGSTGFTLVFNGMAEGVYHLQGSVTVAEHRDGLTVRVGFDRLDCHRESEWDEAPGTWDDEPFVLVSVDPVGNPGDRRSDIGGPYGGVDSGEQRSVGIAYSVLVLRHSGLVISAQMWESDSELAKGRRNLLDAFNSRYGDAEVDERSRFLDAVGSAVGSDWRLDTVDVFAFKRTETVQTTQVVSNRRVDALVEGGSSLHIPFDPVPVRDTWSRPIGEAKGFEYVIDRDWRPPDLGLDKLRPKAAGDDGDDTAPVAVQPGVPLPKLDRPIRIRPIPPS